MNKSLHDLLERARGWPANAQEALAQAGVEIEAELGAGIYRPDSEEQAGIERGLKDAAAGAFATDDQLETVFNRRRPA